MESLGPLGNTAQRHGSGGGGLRHLLARLGFDQGGVAAELGGHFQELFAHEGIGNAIGHAAGAVGLKAIMVNFWHGRISIQRLR